MLILQKSLQVLMFHLGELGSSFPDSGAFLQAWSRSASTHLSTSLFDQINSSGLFSNDFTGTTYQIIGFNYTGTPSGIEIGSNIAAIAATDLDIIPGAVVRGCAAVTTQIDGILFNDKAKNCKEGNQDQNGLPESKIYLKLLKSLI